MHPHLGMLRGRLSICDEIAAKYTSDKGLTSKKTRNSNKLTAIIKIII